MRRSLMLIMACLALAIAGCGGGDDSTTTEASSDGGASSGKAAEEAVAKRTKPKIKAPGGTPPKQLEENEIIEGTGPEAKAGDEVTVQYVGALYSNGQEFDASWDRGEPFTFTLGSGEVIAGWDQGVEGMKVGGRRELIIPPELAYGSQAVGTIPPNSTLIFIVDLLAVE